MISSIFDENRIGSSMCIIIIWNIISRLLFTRSCIFVVIVHFISATIYGMFVIYGPLIITINKIKDGLVYYGIRNVWDIKTAFISTKNTSLIDIDIDFGSVRFSLFVCLFGWNECLVNISIEILSVRNFSGNRLVVSSFQFSVLVLVSDVDSTLANGHSTSHWNRLTRIDRYVPNYLSRSFCS